jgi:putative ABC transport system substrate-binding protein
LELLKEAVPGVSRIGVLNGSTTASFQDFETAARLLKINLRPLYLTSSNLDLEETFQFAAKAGVNGLIVVRDALTASYLKPIANLAIRHRMPSMNEDSPYVEAGGLMSYATNDAESFKRAGYYIDKILKGAKPADLPIEQATSFELVINLKTAHQIGMTIPPNVLARADRVIR